MFVDSIEITKSVSGAALTVTVHCLTCDYSYTKSTSEQKKSMFVINYLLSCAILFVGGLPTKMLRYEIYCKYVNSHNNSISRHI